MDSRDGLILFVLIVNITFPVMAGALTSLNINANFDNSVLSTIDLLSDGIVLTNATSITLTYNVNQTETYVAPDRIYSSWNINGVAFQAQLNQIDKFFNTKYFLTNLDVTDTLGVSWTVVGDLDIVAMFIHYIPTSKILSEYNSDKGYAHGKLIYYSAGTTGTNIAVHQYPSDIFFSYNQTAYSTMTDALAGGSIYVTYGSIIATDANYGNFISWYLGILLGNNTYGMPNEFLWIMRIFIAFSVLATVWLIKDLLRL